MRLCTESIKSIQCKEWHESQWSVCTWVCTAWQLPFLPWEERTVTGTGAAVREGRACGIIWNAEVETEGAKLLCRIKFKERREGYPFGLKMLISCKKWFGDFWRWAGRWESVDSECEELMRHSNGSRTRPMGWRWWKLVPSSLWWSSAFGLYNDV